MLEISIKIVILLSVSFIIIIGIFTYCAFSKGFHDGYAKGRLDEKIAEIRRITTNRRLENVSATSMVQERPVFIDGRKKYGLR